MKKILFLFLSLIAFNSFSTEYSTILDNGVAVWSTDGVTPCNCSPDGDGVGDIVNIYHSIQMTHANFKGRLNIYSGTANFSGGLIFDNGEIYVANGATLKVSGSLASHYTTYEMHGLLDVFGSFTFYWSHLIGSGNMNIIGSCSYYQSSINGVTANPANHCGTYSLESVNTNIWNGNSWSKGYAPNSCSEYAIIKSNYSTSQSSLTANSLVIKPGVTLEIANNSYVDLCRTLVNEGNTEIRNMGSLVQREGSELFNTGSFLYEREGQHNELRYNVWSSPVKDSAPLEQIFPNTNPCDLYVFDAENQVWKYDFPVGYSTTCNGNSVVFGANDVLPLSENNMRIGRGYFVPGPHSGSEVRVFNGEVNNGNINVTISSTSAGDNPKWLGDDWNLIGNPYPCSLDAQEFWDVNTQNGELSDGIYLWLEEALPPFDQFKSYLVWNPLGATYIKDGTAPFDGVIPSCAGFWVYMNSASNANLTTQISFTNAMRLTNGRSLVKSGKKKTEETAIAKRRMWVTLTTDSNQYDQILIGQMQGATDNIDPLYDAHYNASESKITLTSVVEDEQFTIQSFTDIPSQSDKVVDLFIHTQDSSVHYLTIDSIDNFNQFEFYFIDSRSNDTLEMTVNSPVEITNLDTGVYASTFQLLLRSQVPNSVQINMANDQFETTINNGVLWVKSDTEQNYQVTVYDLSGKLCGSSRASSGMVSTDLNTLKNGIYLVNIQKNGSTIYSKKISLNR